MTRCDVENVSVHTYQMHKKKKKFDKKVILKKLAYYYNTRNIFNYVLIYIHYTSSLTEIQGYRTVVCHIQCKPKYNMLNLKHCY